MIASRELPARHELIDYGHAVAGHAGTLSDAEGELFIKPCTRAEIDFYQVANRRHASFADLMPLFMGTLSLSDAAELSSMDEAVSEDALAVQTAGTENKDVAIGDNIVWKPNGTGKIQTEQAAVLENAAYGFKQPNIVDVKLGVRLWADDAPLQKRQRCDKITSETTHGKLGFRIAGMRVYKGSEDPEELGEDGYRTYDRNYGRLHVNDDNVADAFRRFIFNKAADIDEELGKAVCKAFLHDLRRVEEVLSRHESRMYSASLLFVFEGDGKALEAAIERNNDEVGAHFEKEKRDRTTLRVDSGIALDDGDDLEEDAMPALPRIYTLKLIDFAHAQFTPGLGPDENALTGVRSLISIFEELSR